MTTSTLKENTLKEIQTRFRAVVQREVISAALEHEDGLGKSLASNVQELLFLFIDSAVEGAVTPVRLAVKDEDVPDETKSKLVDEAMDVLLRIIAANMPVSIVSASVDADGDGADLDAVVEKFRADHAQKQAARKDAEGGLKH